MHCAGQTRSHIEQPMHAQSAIFRRNNECFDRNPSTGPTGQAVLHQYRALEEITAQAGRAQIAALAAMLRDMSDGK